MTQNKISIHGFTLIEVLIVVIIVGILVSMAIPTYIKTIEKGKAQEAINNLRLIQVEEKKYFHRQGAFAYDKVPGDGGAFIILNMEKLNANPVRCFDYFIYIYKTDPPNFEAKAKRRSDAGSPYKKHEYVIHKDGTVNGPFAY